MQQKFLIYEKLTWQILFSPLLGLLSLRHLTRLHKWWASLFAYSKKSYSFACMLFPYTHKKRA